MYFDNLMIRSYTRDQYYKRPPTSITCRLEPSNFQAQNGNRPTRTNSMNRLQDRHGDFITIPNLPVLFMELLLLLLGSHAYSPGTTRLSLFFFPYRHKCLPFLRIKKANVSRISDLRFCRFLSYSQHGFGIAFT